MQNNHYQKGTFGASVRDLLWKVKEPNSNAVLHLMQTLNIPELLAMILVNRDVETQQDAEHFLDPKLKNSIPDPFLLKDCDKAAARIADAIEKKEKIAVFGDYDVDGATSSALLHNFFSSLNVNTIVYIPNRIEEGYGPSALAFERLREMGVQLIITVDCGISAFEPIKAANEMGMDVIVIDHHLSIDKLPEAVAIVNPNRFDETFPEKNLAAVGVCFLMAIAIRIELRNRKFFEDHDIPEPDLMQLLDLVALGTVCDVVPLTGMNRAFVTQGLKLLSNRTNLGLSVLADHIKLSTRPQSYHLGFVFGPRINAGGRVGEGILGSKLLTTNSRDEAMLITRRLEELNEERKSIEVIALEDAIAQIEEKNLSSNPVIIAVGQDWHIGILGILASRIKERYNKPTAVISITGNVGKGSARSIHGVDFGTAISEAKALGFLIDGGGHPMAGGFSVKEEKIDALYQHFLSRFSNTQSSLAKARELNIEIVVNLPGINMKLLEIMEMAAPFGSGNPQPKIAVRNVVIFKVSIMKPNHIIMIIADALQTAIKLKCILFKGANTPLGDFLLHNIGKKISIVGIPQSNSLNTSKIDFILEDVSVE